MLAQVPVDARGAEHRPGLAQRDRVLGREQADAAGALEEDDVVVEERLVLVDALRHHSTKRRHSRVEAGRDVLCEAAGLEVAGVHPHARDHLEEVEHQVALAERVPEDRDRPQLEPRRPEPDEVRVNPRQLREQRAHPDRLRRRLDPEQLLDRHHEAQLVLLEVEVVHPRGIGDRLPVGLLLHVLLEAGVEVADHRVRPTTVSPSSETTRRRTPWVDGWLGPKLTVSTSPDFLELRRHEQDRRDRLRDA